MRPIRSFLLLLIFLAVLTGLHYVLPVHYLFPSPAQFFPDGLVSFVRARTNTPEPVITAPQADTIKLPVSGTVMLPEGDSSGTVAPQPGPIDRFLDSVRYSKGQVRIMYYGDSQIEGDRITSYLRHSLREGHNGTGPGLLLPVMPVMYTKTVWIKSSSNWIKYNYLSYKTGEIPHRKLGPFMAVCRYLPEGKISDVPVRAYMRIRPSGLADTSSSHYDCLRLFYGNAPYKVVLDVRSGSESVFRDTLKPGPGIRETGCSLRDCSDVTIWFEGKVSPDIYGISLESRSGIIVDNIPQRGSAGLEFTMVDSSNLAESYRLLRPDLIILHYGLNIVRNVRKDYSYFRKGLGRQLDLLHRISPSTPVLVMSLTDMAETRGDSIMSYRNIPAILIAQRQAAADAGETFWDSYSSMGGKSAIIRWVEMNPPLAQKDYVHFTYQGADTFGRMLMRSLFTGKADTIVKATVVVPDTILPVAVNTRIPQESGSRSEKFAMAVLHAVFSYDPDKPMIFTTYAFWIFFLLVLAGYSIVYKKLAARNMYLFLVSLFFYYKAGGLFLFILIFVTLVDYTCGLFLSRTYGKGTRRFFVLLSIFSNLGLLGYFKYAGFIVDSLNTLFGTSFRVYDLLSDISNTVLGTSFDITSILLPVGISFFTFQSLSYVFDLYHRRMEPVKNIIDFGFYVSFFPHLVAGPIVRASVFIPQIYQEFRLTRNEFSHAVFMILKGMVKKVIISNFLALNLVDRIFDAPSVYSGFENLLAVYGYGLQIYCDFSGYTDIAIGVALIIGFRLPVNFYSPYKALNISEFWKRWHISLSQWLRDYIYIGLGGNRKGKLRTYLNLMVTMLLGGLWHGASLKFIIWGALHGAGLIVNKIWNSVFRGMKKAGVAGRIISVLVTFHFVSFCWIFFRAPDLASVGTMLDQIFGSFSPGSYMTVLPAYTNAMILIIAGYLIHFLPESIKESYRGLFINVPVAVQMAVVLVIAVLLYQMRTTDVLPFIYFRF